MTRDRTSPLVEPEDLSARARRGALSEGERSSFEQAVNASQVLAVAHRAGLDFDRASAVQPGDEKLIAAMADAALAAPRTRAPITRLRRGLVLGVAAALAVAGSAAAWTLWVSPRQIAKPAAPSNVAQATGAKAKAGALAVAPQVADTAVQATPAAPLTETNLPQRELLGTTPVLSKEITPRGDDAGSLFRRAAGARRASDFGRARTLYLQLEREFPASSEAHLARVSLGKVLLAMGRPQEAEQQFALYLSGGGSLTEEALVGRAQSLARLGRGADERRVWEALLRDFPSSVYASSARDRRSALGDTQRE